MILSAHFVPERAQFPQAFLHGRTFVWLPFRYRRDLMSPSTSPCCTSRSPIGRTHWLVSMICLAPVVVTLGALGCARRDDVASSDRPEQSIGTLAVGDPAPPLSIDQWVNGLPTSDGFVGNVHVVEFWATWCGPCLAGMPHLSSLQDEYGDAVTFIGVTDEDIETVNGFLARESLDGRPWSEVITYRLATDNQDATNTAYMRAANQNGIPTAFIVGREGRVEWIGHPGQIDEPLRRIVQGG